MADDTAPPDFVAADLLAHAERDPDAICSVITTSEEVARGTHRVLGRRVRTLPKDHPARGPIRRAQAVVVADLDEAASQANERAPEVLSVLVRRPDDLLDKLWNFGTLLVGPHTPPSVLSITGSSGLYPAGGEAGFRAPVSVSTFMRRIAAQQVDASAYHRLVREASTLAEIEGRTLGAQALNIRLVPFDDE